MFVKAGVRIAERFMRLKSVKTRLKIFSLYEAAFKISSSTSLDVFQQSDLSTRLSELSRADSKK